MSAIHIDFTRVDEQRIIRSYCPNCNQVSGFYAWFQDWYGWHETCLRCGDQWNDGEHVPRPFKPGWRKENIENAKQTWKQNNRGQE